MLKKIGLISENKELILNLKNKSCSAQIFLYKRVDSSFDENLSLLLVDLGSIDEEKNYQFYLSRLRKKIQDIPVLIVLKLKDISVLKFDWFFDDFILYPFRKGELDVRISQLVSKNLQDSSYLTVGNIKINVQEYSVFVNFQKVELTYKEFELLRLFAENRGRVFSRKELLAKIWGIDYIGGTRTVDVHIRRLRGKLGEEFASVIETIRNVGYGFVE